MTDIDTLKRGGKSSLPSPATAARNWNDSMAETVSTEHADFEIIRVLKRMLGVIMDHGWMLAFIVVALVGLPEAMKGYWRFHIGGLNVIVILATAVLAVAAQAAATLVGLERSQGEAAKLDIVLPQAFGALPGLIVLAVAQLFGVSLGILMLVFPGLYIMAAMSVAAPVLLMQEIGPVKAIRQSIALAQGALTRIFGVIVLVQVVVFGLFYLLWFLVLLTPIAEELRLMAILPFGQSLWTLANGLTAASVFHELWCGAEPGPHEETAEIFD